jgi:enoyl-CoA hydratase/carnithine racemase
MAEKYEQIIFENNNGVAVLTLNRPDALNSLCVSMMEEMRDAFRQCSSDPSIKALVITGDGRNLVAAQAHRAVEGHGLKFSGRKNNSGKGRTMGNDLQVSG